MTAQEVIKILSKKLKEIIKKTKKEIKKQIIKEIKKEFLDKQIKTNQDIKNEKVITFISACHGFYLCACR